MPNDPSPVGGVFDRVRIFSGPCDIDWGTSLPNISERRTELNALFASSSVPDQYIRRFELV